jgi:acyl-CoA synthetase (AMP-forming)/AMP-acid ligase II/aryl carrier-like protein
MVIAPRDAVLDPRQLRRELKRSAISMLQATPTTWQVLCDSEISLEDEAWRLKGLCGGQALSPALGAMLLKRVSSLWNVYGPTETTVWSTVGRLDAGIAISIGRPMANTRVYVLDGHLLPVPMGVTGELYIGGVGLARGYWQRTGLTAARFVADQFGPPGAQIYRTGDLCRYRPEGALEFVGRGDFQVKVRGFRIELGEIEARVRAYPGVRDAVVVASDVAVGDTRLIVYYTRLDGQPAIEVEALRRHVADALPDYMVPAVYVELDAMPLTPNGKTDRAALPAPDSDAYATPVYEAPQGETERSMAAIWAELLRVERVGRHDNFFALGGHSLLAVSFIARTRQIGLATDIRTLFSAPTLAALASATESLSEIVL